MTTDYVDSYYSRTVEGAKTYPKLETDIKTDICIIGGGFAGLAIAYSLSKRGQNVILLEGRRIGYGASGRNGGFVMAGYPAGEHALYKKLGQTKAKSLYDLSVKGLETVKSRIKEHNIPCHHGDGLLIASWWDEGDKMKREVDFLQTAYDADVSYLDHSSVQALCNTAQYYDGMTHNNYIHVHALSYVHGLANAISAMGGKIYEQSMVTRVENERADTKTIHTNHGNIKASQIVYCGSAYSNHLQKKIARSCLPVSTFVMVTEPVDQKLLDQTIRNRHAVHDTRWAYDYYRVLPDNRILWGGRCGLNMPSAEKLQKLMHADMVKVYPQLQNVKVEVAWGGLMGYTVHKMPHIGTLGDGIWYCTHFGGNGYGVPTIAGELISDGLTGQSDDYKIFSDFGFFNAAGPLGPLIAQAVYHSWEITDFIKDLGKKRKTA